MNRSQKMIVVKLRTAIAWLTVLIIFASCNNETIFQSDFNSTPVGNPPAVTQKVGTANVDGPSGSVKVIASPVSGSSDKWVQITRSANQQSVTGLKCTNSKFIGNGKYHFSSALFIPKNTGLVTIQFEPISGNANSLVNFLHIDCMQDGRVRVDDNNDIQFGHYPHDSLFLIEVSLDINDTKPTANIALAGAGTSGTFDYNIQPAFINIARQFNAVRLWMGYPWTGSFDATDIVTEHSL